LYVLISPSSKQAMTLEELTLHIEALVFASDKPLAAMDITSILIDAFPDEEINADNIHGALDLIKSKYNTEFHSFRMVEAGGGFQFLTKSDYHTTVAKLNGDKFMKRLSAAALETLAIIAYRQPVTKPDCEYIRGVSCDYSIQKLLEKELIVISGRNEEAVGKPLLYCTSRSFMDYLGINSMDELPRLREIVGEDIVLPTLALDAIPENPDTVLVVSETGELQEIETASDQTVENNANHMEDATVDASIGNAATVENDGTKADDSDASNEKTDSESTDIEEETHE
jgi:segregation and condensation protein B